MEKLYEMSTTGLLISYYIHYNIEKKDLWAQILSCVKDDVLSGQLKQGQHSIHLYVQLPVWFLPDVTGSIWKPKGYGQAMYFHEYPPELYWSLAASSYTVSRQTDQACVTVWELNWSPFQEKK